MVFDPSWIPAAIGGIKALFGGDGGVGAANKASAASLNQQRQLLDLIRGIVVQADKSGQFSPEDQLAQARQDYQQGVGDIMGQARIGGYRPGDSPIGDSLASRTLDYAKMTRDIRQAAFANKMNAYSMLNPGTYAQNAQGWQQQSQIARQNQPTWAGIATGLIQGLNPGPGTGTSIAASNQTRGPGGQTGSGSFQIPTVSYQQPNNTQNWVNSSFGLGSYWGG